MLLPPVQEIKKRRVALGISQKKLASSIGASQSLIAKIESNRVNPSYDVVKKIEAEGTYSGMPKSKLMIDNCGQL